MRSARNPLRAPLPVQAVPSALIPPPGSRPAGAKPGKLAWQMIRAGRASAGPGNMGGAPPAPSEQRPHPAVHSMDRPCSFPAVSQLPPHFAAQLSVLAGARLLQRTCHAPATRAAKRWGPCIVPFWTPRRSPWRCWQTSPLARAGSPAVLQWKERTRQEHCLPHWPRQSRVRGRSSCAAQIA